MVALAASLMPAHAATAPALINSSVDTGWSGSDKTVVLQFDKNLSAATGSPSTASVLDKNGKAVAGTIAVSNNRLTFTANPSPNPDDANLGNVYMYFRLSPFTINYTAVNRADPTGTTTGSKTFTIDSGAPAVHLDSPTGNSIESVGGPHQVTFAGTTIYTGTPWAVFAPGDSVLVDGSVADRKDDYTTNWTSGVEDVKILLTDVGAQALQGTKAVVAADISNLANCQPASAPTKCSGDVALANIDITDQMTVGTVYSMQVIATDLAGYQGYSQPINLIRLG
jgi:hypothetical protein